MKTKTLKAILILAVALCLLFQPIFSKADTIYITPGTTPIWTQTYSPPSQPTAEEIANWVEYSGTLIWLYKAEVSDPVTEEGPYAKSYSTTFYNSSTDPQDATITYVGGSFISGNPLYLLIKDGNATPTLYIFDLHNINTNGYLSPDSWDGVEPIVMTGFWPAQGAISNVAILGPMTVPEPGIIILFGLGLTAVGIGSRWMRRK